MIYLKIALAALAFLLAVWQRGTPMFFYWILVSLYWSLNAIEGVSRRRRESYPTACGRSPLASELAREEMEAEHE